jgi:hypothetical protein
MVAIAFLVGGIMGWIDIQVAGQTPRPLLLLLVAGDVHPVSGCELLDKLVLENRFIAV